MNRLRLVTCVMLLVAGLAHPRSAFADDPIHALKFDGVSDNVRLAATASVLGAGWNTAKSVSLWVKPTGTAVCTSPAAAACDAILGDKPRSWGISRGTVDGVDRIWVWNWDGNLDKVGIAYTPGEWIHVALVHGGGALKAYKNGTLVGSVASGATQVGGSPVLYFGGVISNASQNWTFEGEIDELQLWNTVRTDAEILGPMTHLLAGNESGLAAYYSMSNGSGTSVTDDSVFSWNGTILDGGSGVPADGFATWVPSGAFGGNTGPPNTPPVADPQAISTNEDTSVGVTLTGWDPDGNSVSFKIVGQPGHGILSGTSPNLTYTPALNFNGSDSFSFVANDGRVDSAPATVAFTVIPQNDVPVAGSDSANTALNTAVVINALSNDSDVDFDTLMITSVSEPSNGTVTFTATQITYTPNTDYSGADSITYTVADGQGGEASALVSITVLSTSQDAGYALHFDGVNDYVNLNYTHLMFGPGWESTKTVSMWVKPTGTAQCTMNLLFTCDPLFGDRPQWWGITRGTVNGQDRIWLYNFDGAIKAVGIPYTVGQWVHIAMVHQNGVMSAFKNGVLVGAVVTGPTRQPPLPARPVLTFGGIIMASSSWAFEGEIDELALWRTARTAQQLTQDMAGPLTGTEEGLAAYYRMTTGSGSVVIDDSGHGWNGTIVDGYQQVPADGHPATWVPSGAFSTP